MTISLGNAIKAVREDEKWLKKVLIGGLIAIVAAIGSCLLNSDATSLTMKIIGLGLYLLFGGFLSGFLVSSCNRMINSDSNALTDWSEPNLLLKGLKFLFSWLVYNLVICTIFCLIILALALILVPINILLNSLIHSAPLTDFISMFVLITLSIVIFLYFMQFLNVAQTSYYKNLKFRDLMSLKKHFRIIKDNQHTAWTLVGKEILYILLFLLTAAILTITVVGILVLPFVYFAAFVVIIHLYSHYGRTIDIGRYLE